MDGTVLVADDDKTIRTVLTQALTRAGCKVQATASLVTLMRWVSEGKGNLVISDIIMPDGNGLELLPEIRKMRPDLPVIIISAQNTLTTAIKVEEGRAFDYLPKPFDLPNLLHKASLGLNNIESGIGKKLPPLSENLPLIGSSPAMLEVYRKLAKLMNLEDTVFIFGENGTGKTLIANTIHNFSDRRNLPFIKVHHDFFSNFELTLDFFKSAKGGSILIEDIDLLDQQRQKTLRLLLDYDFEISPRFLITAKSQDSGKISDNNFEPSLLFRINKLTINVPPLRFRLSDLDSLVQHFLLEHNADRDYKLKIGKEALKDLKDYFWPGNIRQLKNIIYSLSLNSIDNNISAEAFKVILNEQPKFAKLNTQQERLSDAVEEHLNIYFERHEKLLPTDGLYKRILKEVENPLIRIALNACGGNQLKCAKLLGINRNTLRKKIEESDIYVTKNKKMR